jgi:hypothetical protein
MEALKIARITAEIYSQLGRRRKVDAFERIGEGANAPLPDAARSGGFAATLEKFPIADGRSIGDRAGQLDAGACENGLEIVQSPFVVREQAKFGLNVLHCELASGLIGFGNGPGQPPSAQSEGVHLKLKSGESLVIELNLDLRQSEFRAERLIGAAEPNVFRDDSLLPSQAQSGELKIDSALAQFLDERFFNKARQADLVNVNQATEDK